MLRWIKYELVKSYNAFVLYPTTSEGLIYIGYDLEKDSIGEMLATGATTLE